MESQHPVDKLRHEILHAHAKITGHLGLFFWPNKLTEDEKKVVEKLGAKLEDLGQKLFTSYPHQIFHIPPRTMADALGEMDSVFDSVKQFAEGEIDADALDKDYPSLDKLIEEIEKIQKLVGASFSPGSYTATKVPPTPPNETSTLTFTDPYSAYTQPSFGATPAQFPPAIVINCDGYVRELLNQCINHTPHAQPLIIKAIVGNASAESIQALVYDVKKITTQNPNLNILLEFV